MNIKSIAATGWHWTKAILMVGLCLLGIGGVLAATVPAPKPDYVQEKIIVGLGQRVTITQDNKRGVVCYQFAGPTDPSCVLIPK